MGPGVSFATRHQMPFDGIFDGVQNDTEYNFELMSNPADDSCYLISNTHLFVHTSL